MTTAAPAPPATDATTGTPPATGRRMTNEVEPLLMPVVHALIQVREDLERLAATVPAADLWERPGGAASIGFHIRHTVGALDRLFTYARGEALTDAQRAIARAEGDGGNPPATIAEMIRRHRELFVKREPFVAVR